MSSPPPRTWSAVDRVGIVKILTRIPFNFIVNVTFNRREITSQNRITLVTDIEHKDVEYASIATSKFMILCDRKPHKGLPTAQVMP